MRAALGRAVRDEFERRLGKELAQFRKISRVTLAPECRLYEWEYDSELRFFLVLQMNRSHDRFTVEVAWTKNGAWPTEHVPLPESPLIDSPSGEMRFRIGLLWSRQPDHWWQIAPTGQDIVWTPTPRTPDQIWRSITNPAPVERLIEAVPVVVDDVIAKIHEFVIPYFERVIAGWRR